MHIEETVIVTQTVYMTLPIVSLSFVDCGMQWKQDQLHGWQLSILAEIVDRW